MDHDNVHTQCTSRSNSVPYNKENCIICEVNGGIVHRVQCIKTGQRMLEVAKKLEDKVFFLCLNSMPNAADAVATDTVMRQVEPKNDLSELDNFKQIVCDIEIVNLVRCNLADDAGMVMDMNSLNSKNIQLLLENEVDENVIRTNYKPYLKQHITDNIPYAEFVKSPRRNEPEVCNKDTISSAVDQVIKRNMMDDFLNAIYKNKMSSRLSTKRTSKMNCIKNLGNTSFSWARTICVVYHTKWRHICTTAIP